jgi:diaminohydroxyphosphoribosylaminopyrimidine deaminase/5-amino-6-(5-phosphoribosylamino)uracil reductase
MVQAEPGKARTPRVGAVLVKDDRLLGEAFRGEVDAGDHAEFVLLDKKLADADLANATVYTTLEPCTERSEGKKPCADRLIERQVGTVFIGMYDPDPRVAGKGWERLRSADIKLRDFTEELRREVQELNRPFVDAYQIGRAPTGSRSFDFTQNDGRFTIVDPVSGAQFETKWSRRSDHAVYGYGAPGSIALAKYKRSFDELDDPGSEEFASHAVPANEGEIVVFRNAAGYALVMIDEVRDTERGHSLNQLTVTWVLRLR